MAIYEHKKIKVDGFCISPSSIGKFFEYPSTWFTDYLTDDEQSFIGNSSTVLGTTCHYIYEQYGKNREYFVANKEKIYEELETELKTYVNSNLQLATLVDVPHILSTYPQIVKIVVNDYIRLSPPDYVELSLLAQIPNYNGYYLGGTVDNITRDIIVDYKTVKTKPNTEVIPFHYKIQLLAYDYLLKERGMNMNYMRLVYGVAPTKTIGARMFMVEERITEEDRQMFQETLWLMCESIKRCETDPTLIPLIFKSKKLEGRNINVGMSEM